MNSVGDGINYLIFGNPVSHGFISAAASVARSAGLISPKANTAKPILAAKNIMTNSLPLWGLLGRNIWFIRLAGLSGASAVILGAYGSHRNYNEDKGQSRPIFETANRFHFFHSIAMVTVPLCRHPMITGSLMAFGTLLFTCPCYYRAFTGNKNYSTLAPFGGVCLILAWLSMIL